MRPHTFADLKKKWPDLILPSVVGDTAHFSCEWTPNLYLRHQYFLTPPPCFQAFLRAAPVSRWVSTPEAWRSQITPRSLPTKQEEKPKSFWTALWKQGENQSLGMCQIPHAIHVGSPLSIFVKLNFIYLYFTSIQELVICIFALDCFAFYNWNSYKRYFQQSQFPLPKVLSGLADNHAKPYYDYGDYVGPVGLFQFCVNIAEHN